MLYPIYVHPGHAETAFGIQFPDFPGCFSAADEQEDIPGNAQEAVKAHFADGETIPAPSTISQWASSPDYSNGFWMLIDIDLRKVSSKAVRLNISLPDYLVQRIDAAAAARRLSRSAFLALAAEHEMAHV